MRTSSEPLEGYKVKLTVEVDEEEIKNAADVTLRRLTREARVPGFRPGKVPRRLLEARLGPKAIRAEVLSEALPRYYSEALDEASLDVIASPEIDITSGEEAGPLVFDAVVEIRPKVAIPGYDGLVVTLPRPEPSPAEIDAQVDRLREQFAELAEVARPARAGDLATLDIHGTRDGKPAEALTADDLVYEVGSGGIVVGIDAKLIGTKPGDILEIEAADAPGGAADLRVLVKLVREKILPAADDAFASDASEFDTIEELRADLVKRLTNVRRFQAALTLREGALEALVDLVADDVPSSLVEHESEHLLGDLLNRLARQGVSMAQYFASTGKDEKELLAELEVQATRQAKADLALRALAEAESIEVDESDLDNELVRLGQQTGKSPGELRVEFDRDGRLAGLRSELKNAKALAWLVEHVGVVDDEGNPMDRSALLLENPGEPEPSETTVPAVEGD